MNFFYVIIVAMFDTEEPHHAATPDLNCNRPRDRSLLLSWGNRIGVCASTRHQYTHSHGNGNTNRIGHGDACTDSYLDDHGYNNDNRHREPYALDHTDAVHSANFDVHAVTDGDAHPHVHTVADRYPDTDVDAFTN